MRSKRSLKRIIGALVLVGACLGIGYLIGHSSSKEAASGVSHEETATTIAAPPANSVQILYSLDARQNDTAIVQLINNAQKTIYFAMYEFTLKDIADALVRAENRGVKVYGLVDAGESASSYDAPIMTELRGAGIPVETEHHPNGEGIMHIKAIVTDSAYALGSYNWTSSATNDNDELLEIGTDPTVRAEYESILQRLFTEYGSTTAAKTPTKVGSYDYTEADEHIGEYAAVTGTLVDAYTSSSGTVFLDFCEEYQSCPFSSVIFADDASAFGSLEKDAGRTVTITGTITSYNGHAEIQLSDPSMLKVGT